MKFTSHLFSHVKAFRLSLSSYLCKGDWFSLLNVHEEQVADQTLNKVGKSGALLKNGKLTGSYLVLYLVRKEWNSVNISNGFKDDAFVWHFELHQSIYHHPTACEADVAHEQLKQTECFPLTLHTNYHRKILGIIKFTTWLGSFQVHSLLQCT